MDRRRALKQLGAAAALGTAASMIQTAPAFAYDSPTILTNPSVTVIPDTNNNRARVVVTRGTSTCPASASTQQIRTRTRCDMPIVTPTGRVLRRGMDILPQTTNSISYVIRKTESSIDNSGRPYALNDEFRIRIIERHRCIYSDGTRRDVTLPAQFYRARSLGVGGPWSVTPI